jgi:diaminopimelate epimerase
MQYYKLSGAGNDFLALVEPASPPSQSEIAAWCRRGLSLGADGVFVLRRSGPGAVAMHYFNSDGLPAALCLNGTRCAARLAFELGWERGRVRIETGAGAVDAEQAGDGDGDEIALDAPLPSGRAERLDLELAAAGVERVVGHRIRVGVPHFVVECELGVAGAPVRELGPILRSHEAFAPEGTNVHFVSFGDRGLDIRSFERGVEAETLACGSGVLAATAVGLSLGRLALPALARTRGGFVLRVEGEARGGAPSRWRLVGEARLLSRGELLPGAAAPVATSGW